MKRILVLLLQTIMVLSCKENNLVPAEEKLKDPREMTWSADTLFTNDFNQLQIIPQKLVVFSSSEAWLCCWADGQLGQIWRYDGKKWNVNNLLNDVTGKPKTMTGFSNTNLWVGGYIGDYIFISRYNGNNWIDVYPGFYTVNSSKWLKGEILDMTTDASGNIWACGRDGIIMKCSNDKWIIDTIRVGYKQNYREVQYLLHSVEYYKDKIFVLATIFDSQRKKDVYYTVVGDIGKWVVSDSMIIDSPSSIVKLGNNKFYSSNYGKLYSSGQLGVWIYNNTSWEKIYSTNSSVYSLYGVKENYLFAAGDYNLLFYNGNSWNSIASILNKGKENSVLFTNVWTNGEEAIIAGYSYIDGKQRTIVWHGK